MWAARHIIAGSARFQSGTWNCMATSKQAGRIWQSSPIRSVGGMVRLDWEEKGPKKKAPVTSTAGEGGVMKEVEKKPVLKEPIAKSYFMGKLDPEHLIYPEIGKYELEEINELCEPVEKFFDNLDSKGIDEKAKIPEEVLQQIKDLGLFGIQIPQEYGGLGLNATEFARICEITALDGSLAVTLAAHNSIGLKGIIIAGSPAQKQQYLPPLATGDMTAAFALTEPSSGSDAASIQTRATLSEDGKTWHLSGGKIWISNGGIADLFTVFAKTEVTTPEGVTKDKVTAFIVERAFGGVTNGKPEDKLGIRGSNTCEVHFDNTPVPVENVLGEVGGGFKIAMQILNSGRFSMGSSGAGILKKLIGMTVDHASNRKQFGKKLTEFGMIQEKFAKMATTVYAMESMAYLTAGTLDQYDNPDLSVEAAMVKVFSSEGCWECGSECLQILGGLGYMKDYPYERYLRDARILLIFEGTNEILRLFIGLNGAQHAGNALKEVAKRLKSPLKSPGFALSTAVKSKMGRSVTGATLGSSHHEVHLMLEKESNILDKAILDLNTATEALLTQYGAKAVDQQMKVKRLADIAIDCYAMTACIGRANRSLCIGLRNCDQEVNMTKAFCYQAQQRISRNLRDLKPDENRQKINIDELSSRIADGVFTHGGYMVEHALQPRGDS